MIDKVKQGKKNRESGARFERKVRKDLESKGWIVSKWMNNVDLILHTDSDMDKYLDGKLIPAKHKFRGKGIPMAIGTGFPDFIAYKFYKKAVSRFYFMKFAEANTYVIRGIEVKSNGYLTKEEKEKCKWLLQQQIFSKILIAKKGKKRGEIVYKEFEKGGKWK